jgi:hypothetical protein
VQGARVEEEDAAEERPRPTTAIGPPPAAQPQLAPIVPYYCPPQLTSACDSPPPPARSFDRKRATRRRRWWCCRTWWRGAWPSPTCSPPTTWPRASRDSVRTLIVGRAGRPVGGAKSFRGGGAGNRTATVPLTGSHLYGLWLKHKGSAESSADQLPADMDAAVKERLHALDSIVHGNHPLI